ncbi:MAG: DegQ family serine endoprotease [bacterium]
MSEKNNLNKIFGIAVACLVIITMINHFGGKKHKIYKEPLLGKRDYSRIITPETFVQLAERLNPAVVNISTTKTVKRNPHHRGFGSPFSRRNPYSSPFDEFFDRFFGGIPRRKFKQKSLGSGFIINTDGYIITNNHVVTDVDEVKVTLNDQREFTAKVIGTDAKLDIGLIKIKSWKSLPTAILGDSDRLRVGEWVMAIGNPFGLDHTVTTGIISAKGRVIGAGPYDDFIQTDASINPGNSGGPLFNLAGEVVGINTAILQSGQGIGFAIPINMAKDILDDLTVKGEVIRGWMGIMIQKLTPGLAKSFGLDNNDGALVAEVVSGSPADRGGIKPGDIVVSFGNDQLHDYGELTRLAAKTKPGTRVKIKIIRNGQEKELDIEIAAMPDNPDELSLTRTSNSGKLGLTVGELTDKLKSRIGIAVDHGVAVKRVEPGSPAQQEKIRSGDVIVEINREKVASVDDYNRMIGSLKSGDSVLLLVAGDRHTRYVSLKIP